MSLFTTLYTIAVSAIQKDAEQGNGALRSITRTVVRYPVKAIATFLLAPFLAIRVAMIVKNPIRRTIAVVGLLLSVVLAWLAGTFLGSAVGGLFVMTHVSVLVGIGFLLGTTFSVVLSAAFSIFVLNATSWLFLHMNSEDVVDHLKGVSQD